MRSEQEMLDLILDTARADERIRAVVMNGSRANPNAPHDRFQDFDVVYFVTDVKPFDHNFEWLKRFGEIMIMQMPEDMDDPPPNSNGGFVYLMQFMDGNRIDLGIDPFSMIEEITSDSQTVVLLDKDGRIGPLPPASDRDYIPKPPTAKAFDDCCNEFWWLCPYVAKALWRREITNAKHFLDDLIRTQLMHMLDWSVGMRTGFSKSPGKFGKYLQQYLSPEEWELLMATYSDAGYEHTWQALEAACRLFRQAALEVAAHFGYDYPHGDDARVSAHLQHVCNLPADAVEIY
jgi:aminoglycoside 6-adenylyltransferase